MTVTTFSHRAGEHKVPAELKSSLIERLKDIRVPMKRLRLREIRASIRAACSRAGFSGKVPIHRSSRISVEGIRDNVGLCLQTGNVARVYADLLKVQLLYLKGDIGCAVMIVMDQRTAKAVGSNLANWERLTAELEIFKQVITVPTLVLGIGGPE